jgi:regulatory protein
MTAVLDTLVAVRRTAMDLLARREHGRVELTRKLRQRGALPEMIETALDRLTEEGLLSEARYLESFVSYRARSGYGPLRIREELSQRGLQRIDIELALRESGIDWQAQLAGRYLAPQVLRAIAGRRSGAGQTRQVPGVSGILHGNDQPPVQRSRDGRLNWNGPLFR